MANRFTTLLKNFFVKDRELKLLAVLLAILSFYTIRGATSNEVPYVLPVEVRVEQGEGIAILDQDPRTVEVTFRGSRDDLGKLDPSQMKVVVKPKANDPAGSENITIVPREITGTPVGVRVVRIRPGTVTVLFDREDAKEVAVIKPRVVGKPLVGKVEIDYEPRTVMLRGPRRRLKDKAAVVTEAVDVDGRVESFTKRVRVIPPSDAWVSSIEPSEILVKVTVVTETVSRDWESVPVLAMVHPEDVPRVTIAPATVKLSLHGRADVLGNIVPENVKVFVDAIGLDPTASYELPVSVYLPGGIDVNAHIAPETVTVTFKTTEAAAPGEAEATADEQP